MYLSFVTRSNAGARLTEVTNTAANGDQAGVRYTLALDDQRTEAVEESGAKWQYGYDGLKQLVTAKKTDTQASVIPPLDQSYAYDPMGNRRTYADQSGSTAYTANNANQYTAVGGVASVYDHNGNLLTDGVKNYTWDAENQLTSVTPVNPTEGSAKVEYTYDWRMRRKDKKSYVYANDSWTLARTHTFRYHEWNPIEETIAEFDTPESRTSNLPSRASAKRYVWGNDLSGNMHGAGGVGGLLSMKYNGENYFYAYDGNGNVRALVKADATNPAASGVVERYAYDGFGRELPSSTRVASRISLFAFSTKYLEHETGMNYYGYRFYAADKGRWVNRDVIKERGGLNIYTQCGNGLIGAFDVLGMWKITRDSSKDIANAVAESGDTWEGLALLTKLDASQSSLWVTDYDTQPKACKKYGIPNVIYKGWAGDLGWLGRRYVGWDLRELFSDFKVKEYYYTNPTVENIVDIQAADNPFGRLLKEEAASKSLHGFYIDGHGNENGVGGAHFYDSKMHYIGTTYTLNYSATKLRYNLAYVAIRACMSEGGNKYCSANGTCITTPKDEYYWPLFGPAGGVDLPFGASGLLPWNWF